ncbi:hypothetical protein RND71_018517 [Anisodus tanguticus]|uniref:NADH:ubiquinone oxidoreductase-like 20kDa subunit domain-containing protein n=1 Tax=Anisodus tanguticus TaxID=243964 RepID=A0AAE1S6A1_9SOLA|nr:hypothetical protein RND71_018517 [Anisodus tanguticus]
MFSTDSYSSVRGVDKLIPVDVYLPGCPSKTEAVIDAITKLRKKISRELYEDRIRSQRVNQCFTTNHKFDVRRNIHTGNYDQRVLIIYFRKKSKNFLGVLQDPFVLLTLIDGQNFIWVRILLRETTIDDDKETVMLFLSDDVDVDVVSSPTQMDP